jgi:hypothetical protein
MNDRFFRFQKYFDRGPEKSSASLNLGANWFWTVSRGGRKKTELY